MNEVFLEISFNQPVSDTVNLYQLPVQLIEKEQSKVVIFNTEQDYVNCLNAIEKVSNHYLSEYWLTKTPELIQKNRAVIQVLKVIHIACEKKYSGLHKQLF